MSEGKISLGRPARRWKDNIKSDLGEIAWEGMNLVNVAQDRDRWRALMNTVINFVSTGGGGDIRFSRRSLLH
jgi:hypothetical protein